MSIRIVEKHAVIFNITTNDSKTILILFQIFFLVRDVLNYGFPFVLVSIILKLVHLLATIEYTKFVKYRHVNLTRGKGVCTCHRDYTTT